MNLPTLIIAGIVAATFVGIIIRLIINKKNGKSSCGGCTGCSMSNKCHK